MIILVDLTINLELLNNMLKLLRSLENSGLLVSFWSVLLTVSLMLSLLQNTSLKTMYQPES